MSEVDQKQAEVAERVAAMDHAEQQLLEMLRARSMDNLLPKLKRGMKAQAFLESGLGRAVSERLNESITSACITWLTEDDPAKVGAALIEGRAALGALTALTELIGDGAEARQQIASIESEFGDD